ncbi:hypothetical protein LEP1GSC052_0393 [Leptospira kmetyi serovar Malaysia str. Bejo-Iso9]|nr:hypothetical protein LEP1GSC052_0393 [Leptospira kmetyi serovar Malaysia str. Bejo-Iso9]
MTPEYPVESGSDPGYHRRNLLTVQRIRTKRRENLSDVKSVSG